MSLFKNFVQQFKKIKSEAGEFPQKSEHTVVTNRGDEVKCSRVESITVNGVNTPVDGFFIGIDSADGERVAGVISIAEATELREAILDKLDAPATVGRLTGEELSLGIVTIRMPTGVENKSDSVALFEINELGIHVTLDELRKIAALLKES